MAADNPVACVLEFKLLLHDVLTILFGCTPSNFSGRSNPTKKTKFFKIKHKGIFGITLAFFGTIEDHKKGTLHVHLIIWGGLSPELLQKFAGIEAICAEISTTLDTMFTAHFPDDIVLLNSIHQVFKEKNCTLPRETLTPPIWNNIKLWKDPTFGTQHLKQSVIIQTKNQQWHQHTFTCKKVSKGT